MVETILLIVLSVAVATERLTEVVKPLYLKIKNIITKKQEEECTKTEKTIMAILIGIILALISGVNLGITGMPIILQQIMIGLFASFGSGFIHTIINLVIAFKEQAEGIK
jgi:hypothetical protein